MAASKIQGSQRDFSFGEIDSSLKRADDHPARKGGLRQMSNTRILNSGVLQDRPGRSALFPTSSVRIEEFTISSGNIFKIAFAAGQIEIINTAGAVVQTFADQGNGAALPWASAADIQSIDYTIFNLTLTVCFGHAMRPQVITFDGVATWSIADYTEAVTVGGQKRTPFYRLSPQNVTMLPSGGFGAITLKFSSPIVVAGMVGTRMRFAGRQVLLGAVIDTFNINATVIEPLPAGQTLSVTGAIGAFNIGDLVEGEISGAQGVVISSPNIQSVFVIGVFQIGDLVTGGTSGATGIVTARSAGSTDIYTIALNTGAAFVFPETITGPLGIPFNIGSVGPTALVVQLIQVGTSVKSFAASEAIASAGGSATTTAAAATGQGAITVWDDEIMNSFRGFPASCFSDQFRLGFCDFPALPGGVGWSAINSATDLYANDTSSPDNAIFEIAPGKVKVRYVVPGPESSEFVFCDTKIYYIPISVTNPLVPGSVAFQLLSGDGAASVKPRIAQEAVLYVNAGQNSMFAVIATGAYNKPFNTKDLSQFHQHLFNNIQAIAAPNADGTFNERYAYVLNGDGSIACGKYNPESLQTNLPVIGWGPWSGVGVVSWVAAWNADVIFTASYFGAGICEILDDTQYLDCALVLNNLPAPFAPPGGKGNLWFIPSQTVDLIDQVTRFMGVYWIDPNGFLIPQFSGGENLSIASLVAGQPWTMTVEPFAQDATPGADMHQRMGLRQISNLAVYVINSTGFLFASLFSAKQTATSPPLGTVTGTRPVAAWNEGDNATLPPPLRETAESWTPTGSSFDPRVAIIKDNPGPLMILEIGMEISI